MKGWGHAFVVCGLLSCSNRGPTPAAGSDARADVTDAAPPDASLHEGGRDGPEGGGLDGAVDAPYLDGTLSDVAPPTTALVRLANWSPDAPGVDFCVAPHATSSWSGPMLGAAVGRVALGAVTVVDAAIPVDAGSTRDAGARAGDGGSHASDASADAAETARDGQPREDGDDATLKDAGDAGALDSGVHFPGVSPYLALAPGEYDLRVVSAGSADCGTPLLPDVLDFPALRAGSTVTLATVGDTVEQGADPRLTLSIFSDDTTAPEARLALRFINAVPSVVEISFVSGTVATATAVPYLAAAQFGSAGVDTDAGVLDSNNYLSIAPIVDAVWSLVNANGGIATLVAVEGASVPPGIATVVAVGGESGAGENAIGILVCTDQPPVVAGETAACKLLQGTTGGVCSACP